MLGRIRTAAVLAVAAYLLSVFPAFAHEGGHDDDDAARALLAASTFPRVAARSETYEVVGILKGDRLTLYLDRAESNAPVTGAAIQVTIGTRDAVAAEPTPDGAYTLPLGGPLGAESIEVVFSIVGPDGDDLLIGTLQQPRPPEAVAAAPGAPGWAAWTRHVPPPLDNPVVLGFALVVLAGTFNEFRRRRLIAPAVATAGALVVVLGTLAAVAAGPERQSPGTAKAPAAPATSDAPRRLGDGTVFAAKPTQRLLDVRTAVAASETVHSSVRLIGRVIADPNRTGIVQSIHGGRVMPLEEGLPRIGQAVSKDEVLARIEPYLPLADRTTISEKAGEIEQLIAVVEARIRRLRPLAETSAVPRSQVADLETELEGLKARREAVRSTRSELEPLRAPADGVISTVTVVPGQVVQPQDAIFQIVDPAGLWVEALAYGGPDPATLSDAVAQTTAGQAMPLSLRGVSRTLKQHATVVHFAIPEPPPGLNVGQPVTVAARTTASTTGVILPREAVVRSTNGESVVWVHEEPERFEARPVRTRPLDATRVVAAAGLTGGERLVVRGADLINQIR
jgi:RND family efflux transporter MFP subunit